MKHRLLLGAFALLLFTYNATAQGTAQGKLLIGTTTHLTNPFVTNLIEMPNSAGISIVTTKFKSDSFEGDTDNLTAVNLSPSLGICLTDRVLVGVDVLLGYFSFDGEALTLLAGGPYARYYFSNGKIQPFGQVNLRAGRYSAGSDDNDKVNIFQFGIQGGAAFFIGDNVSIDLFAGFNRARSAFKDSNDNARDIQNAFGLGAGISVFLNKKE